MKFTIVIYPNNLLISKNMNNKSKRGRPPAVKNLDVNLNIFNRVYSNNDGSVETWKYDLLITKNGPIEIDITYPKGFKSMDEIQDELPKTKRKYFYEDGAKWINYTRAKGLGII
jgi:small-conductance mechanosensitive channel